MLEQLQVQRQRPEVDTDADAAQKVDDRGWHIKMGALGAMRLGAMKQLQAEQDHFSMKNMHADPDFEQEPIPGGDWDDVDDDDDFLSMPPPPPPKLVRENAVLSLDALEMEMPKTHGPIVGAKHGLKPMRVHPYRRQHSAIWSVCAHQLNPP